MDSTGSISGLMPDRIRAFIAVRVPTELREQVIAVQHELRGLLRNVAWTRPDALHLTLAFLAELQTNSLAGLSGQLAKAAGDTAAFDLEAGDLGSFGDRVIWIGFGRGADELAALAGKVRSLIQGLGVRDQERPFTGHITLGRARQRAAIAQVVAQFRPLPKWARWRVQEIELFRSELLPDGARHSTLGSYELRR